MCASNEPAALILCGTIEWKYLLSVYEEKSRRCKRVEREPMNEFKDLVLHVYLYTFLPSPFLSLLLFHFRIACLCRRQLNPNRESKDSSMDALPSHSHSQMLFSYFVCMNFFKTASGGG